MMNIGNINKLMKQAQEMQKNMGALKEKLDTTEYEGQSGGGMVKVVLMGSGELKKINIDPQAIDLGAIDMLEDLIVAAFNDAKKKADEASEGAMGSAFGGMNLPAGMKFPF